MKKKIVFFTGAGISAESGIATFRTGENATWDNVRIEKVATPRAWKADRELVLEFYNDRRADMSKAEPNAAHKAIGELEKDFDVTVVTQNIDDLHERGGAKKVYHIHGEIHKARSTVDPDIVLEWKKDIEIGDKCEKGSQLRPHVVWFEEYPFFIDESVKAIGEADYVVVVGTGLDIHYTAAMIAQLDPETCKLYYVDPSPAGDLEHMGMDVNYVKEPATTGVPKVLKEIENELN
jgi:NAD-dependent deacetylase